MPDKKTKKNTAKRSSGKTAPRKKKSGGQEQNSVLRELIGCLLVLLALFSLLAFFTDAVVIAGLFRLERGLFGTGAYLMFALLFLIALELFRSAGKSVWQRCTVTLLIAVVFGAAVQVFQPGADEIWDSAVLPSLYMQGVSAVGGGVFSGLLGSALLTGLGKSGAMLVLVLLFALCLMAPLRMTPRSLILAIRNRPQPERPQKQDTAEKLVNHIAESRIARDETRKARVQERRPVKPVFDLPVDDPVLPTEDEEPEPPAAETVLSAQEPLPQETPEPEYIPQEQESAPPDAEDVMELPLITELIKKKKYIARAEREAPQEEPEDEPEEVLSARRPGKLYLVEPPTEMPVFDPDAYRQTEEPPEEEPEPCTLYAEPIGEPEPEPEPEDIPAEEPEDEEPEETEPAPVVLTCVTPEKTQEEPPAYRYPPIELLNPAVGTAVDATEEMRLNAERLSDTLQSFGIQPNIVNVTRGPTVTRYELQLNRGVKLSRITGLSEDIALALGATGVRISAIPEKVSVVGIEVPNRAVSTVYIREVIDSKEFSGSKSKIAFAVGKDIGGNRVISNIAKLPHLLIAGTTGSGKSVCMNSLIISLLYRSSPEDVRLIMIDPKMVELGVYNGIPHLLIPVVTDPKKASGSLQWAVTEMMRRYSIMAESGTRDLASYNKAIEGNPERKKLPQIVVVIDELADLMLVAAKEVEESICRVAQMGRAAGVHLVIATQRPSANVITGLMKANIPSRIAFAVASAMESRIILDTGGAEKLVGRGDMLYAPLGEGKAKRVQGCFITDDEVQRVAEYVKQSGKAEYSKEIMEQIDRKAEQTGKSGGMSVSIPEEQPEDDRDELLYEAVDVFMELRQASVSVLQRKLKLGYSRASRIVDQMEEIGIVGPHKGSKPRDILISKEKWESVKAGLEQLDEPVPDEL